MKQSWDDVKCETVMNCFKHCGVAAVNPGNDWLSVDIDPFGDLDCLQELLVHVQPELTPPEYIDADENLATGPTFDINDSSDWREDL